MSLFEGPKNEGEAAGQAVGSLAGSALPVPYIGSFLGGAVGKIVGGLFGGGEKRVTLGVSFKPNSQGLLETDIASTKGAPVSQARDYAGAITSILNQFGSALGLKYTKNFNSETNIGSKDQKTVFHNKVISSKPGDVEAVAFNLLKNDSYYTMGNDAELNKAFKDSLTKAKSLGEVAADIDAFTAAKVNKENETKAKETQDVSQNFVTTQNSDDAFSRVALASMSGKNAFVLIGLAALVIMMKSKG